MKRLFSLFVFCLASASVLPLLTCGSVEPNVLGDLASAGASALGADDNVASAIGKGVGTFAESAQAADSLTPENEYYIGRAVAANIASRYKVDTGNPALQAYLNKICAAITINSSHPDIFNGYHVAVLDTQEVNAFATPGGHVFLTKGLLACTSTEDEIASVIAHEIAHIQLRHGLTAIRNAAYINAVKSGLVTGIGSAAGDDVDKLASILGDSVGEIVTTLVSNGYGREQEYNADAEALALLAAAGYEPSSIIQMLHSLEKNQKSGSGFGKTHPSPSDRIAGVNKSLNKYRVVDTRGFRKKRYEAVKK